MLLPQSRGPRVSRHHIQENTRQLPDSPGPSSPPVPGSNIASLGPLSKGRRSHGQSPHPPTSSSVSGGKCKRAGVEMLQSGGKSMDEDSGVICGKVRPAGLK